MDTMHIMKYGRTGLAAFILAVFTLAMLPSAPSRAAEDVAGIQAQLTRMSPGSQVKCQADKYGNALCTVDDFHVDYSGCNDIFGAIAAKGGIDLQENIHDRRGKSAHLHDAQFVCIAATARDDKDRQRYYVTALPTSIVPQCKGKSICRDGDQPILWIRDTTGPMCYRNKDGVYAGDCAGGWVDSDVVDAYTNGF